MFQDNRPVFIAKFHYLYFAALSFLICLGVTVFVSMVTQSVDERYLYRLTFGSRFSRARRYDLNDSDAEDIDEQDMSFSQIDNQGSDRIYVEKKAQTLASSYSKVFLRKNTNICQNSSLSASVSTQQFFVT